MVTKKRAKKNKQNDNHSEGNQKKLFGLDLRAIGGAIATAVVTEIAQTALNKASHSNHQNSGQDGDGSAQSGGHQVRTQAESVAASVGEKVGGVGETLVGATSGVGDRLKETLSSTEGKVENWQSANGTGVASKIVQEILEEVKPTLIQFIETIIENTETAYRSALGTTDSLQDLATERIDAAGRSASEPSRLFQSISGEVLRSVQNGVAGAADTAKAAFEDVKASEPKGKKKKKKKNKK